MKQLTVLTLSFAVGASLLGCRQEEEASDTYSSDAQTDALESAVTMVQGQADDAAGGTFALQTRSSASKYAIAESLLFSSANAANCGRAFAQSCSVGVKSISYTNCSIGSAFTLNGSVTLTYSDNGCALDIGDNVVRTYDHSISGPRGGAIQTTSTLRTDYRGTQIGGGGRLERTGASAWQIEVLGKHKIGTRNGRTLFDVSARTTTPVDLTGTLDRSSRTVSAGAIEINHNRAQFTAVYSVAAGQPLVWNSSCCHPISGQLNATYTGSVTGSGSVTFNGCGSAQLSKDGSNRTLSLGYCE
ncbi:MAG: hypothetical protein J0L82_15425 [Deltaproteobacteria bacterium]|nr:hypothetical protein [Deltaproteobacteria bacterium]